MRAVLIGLVMLGAYGTVAHADDASRAAVFNAISSSKACSDNFTSMVALSYCQENVEKQARQTAVFYVRKALAYYKRQAQLPDEPGITTGAEAQKAAQDINAMARAYDLMIKSDCSVAGRVMGGGSGTGNAIQSCTIAHLDRQINRLRNLVGQ